MSHSQSKTAAPHAVAAHQPHRGGVVRVGNFTLLAGGTQYFGPEDLRQADVLVPLTDTRELEFGHTYTIDPGTRLTGIQLEPDRSYTVLSARLVDFGGVPDNWGEFLKTEVIPLLEAGKTLLAFCIGSHGRTGTFIASLIAILEPEVEDPIAAARERHCVKSVETQAQAEAIFALRGQALPENWRGKFHR